MIHYHGLPITPATAAVQAVQAGHAFVSYRHKDQLGLAVAVCSSFAVDNGAFSAWRSGNPVSDWSGYYAWAENCMRVPSCDFAVIPDVIDGDESDNDELVDRWPLPVWFGAPVWHMHETLERLERLAKRFPRVCLGSSGDYATVGTYEWWSRISEALGKICDSQGRPICKLHGLRMLNPDIFTRLPFASADSTNIGRNIGLDSHWAKGSYLPTTKEARASIMRQRIESQNAPATWQENQPYYRQGVLL
jgi:hypothetical protein